MLRLPCCSDAWEMEYGSLGRKTTMLESGMGMHGRTAHGPTGPGLPVAWSLGLRIMALSDWWIAAHNNTPCETVAAKRIWLIQSDHFGSSQSVSTPFKLFL